MLLVRYPKSSFMSLLSSIDTSQFTTPFAAVQEISPFQVARQQDYAREETPNVAAEDTETPKVDLSNYYSNVQPPEVNNSFGSNISQASQNLDNAIHSAIENGFTPQDAVYIQKAKAAYQAMINIANSSNFEIEI